MLSEFSSRGGLFLNLSLFFGCLPTGQPVYEATYSRFDILLGWCYSPNAFIAIIAFLPLLSDLVWPPPSLPFAIATSLLTGDVAFFELAAVLVA